MKFGNGKIGMVTVNQKAYDLTEEPSAIGCNKGFLQAKAIDENSQIFTVFFKDALGFPAPWNVEKAESKK